VARTSRSLDLRFSLLYPRFSLVTIIELHAWIYSASYFSFRVRAAEEWSLEISSAVILLRPSAVSLGVRGLGRGKAFSRMAMVIVGRGLEGVSGTPPRSTDLGSIGSEPLFSRFRLGSFHIGLIMLTSI